MSKSSGVQSATEDFTACAKARKGVLALWNAIAVGHEREVCERTFPGGIHEGHNDCGAPPTSQASDGWPARAWQVRRLELFMKPATRHVEAFSRSLTKFQLLQQTLFLPAVQPPGTRPILFRSTDQRYGVGMLAVTDTGVSMSPDVVERAFDPFFSTKPEGQGSGLGLSMAYGFVKQSGGHIRLYSEVGEGTTVRVYLPRSTAAPVDIELSKTSELRHGNETILVVEDDQKVRETVVELLRGLGYVVLKAHNAEQALAIVESGAHIDLLFTDVVMPGSLRSPEMVSRAVQILPALKVLYTSGYTQNAIVHGGRLDPGVELLSKPYSRQQLALKIRQVLGNSEIEATEPEAPDKRPNAGANAAPLQGGGRALARPRSRG
ncbi:ATP-binding protein [Ralstonia solanacearum]